MEPNKSYGWAKYIGANRRHIFAYGEKYNIADVSKDCKRVALDPGNGELEWMHVNAIEHTTPPESAVKMAKATSDFLEPNKTTLANLDAEIKRIEERLTALRAARAVVASL